MKINKDGHVFTIAFTFVCTIVLVFPLTLAYIGTKPIADDYWRNQHFAKTLQSLGIDTAKLSAADIKAAYEKLEKFTIGTAGKDSAGKDMVVYAPIEFNDLKAHPEHLVLLPVTDDIINKALQDTSYTGNLPVFFYAGDVNGERRYAGDFTGPGLWGNVSLAVGVTADLSTLTGLRVLFNVETPGLGGRIGEPDFFTKFTGKKPNPANEYAAGLVFNQAGANADNGFDAIAGATITSTAVKDTVNQRALVLLKAFIQQKGGTK